MFRDANPGSFSGIYIVGGCTDLRYEIYKWLHIIPVTFIVDEHHVHFYASKKNTGAIVRAPRSVDLFSNSIATPAVNISSDN